jgi:hypothetical protein
MEADVDDDDDGIGSNEIGAPPTEGVSIMRRLAIGCFTAWLGFVSGAMVAALLSKFTAFVTKTNNCDGIPSCNWYIWAGIGGVIGAITLPMLVMIVLGKPVKAKAGAPQRNEF